MPTTTGESLPRLPQLVVEDIDVRRRSLAVMRDVTIRQEVRDQIDALGQRERRNQWLRTEGRRGIEIAAQEAALLLAAGAARGEVLQLPLLLIEIIEDLCDGGAGGDRLEMELLNMRLDAEEDALQGRALVDIESPEEKIERARLLRREASQKFALARQLEGEVRRRALHLDRRTA